MDSNTLYEQCRNIPLSLELIKFKAMSTNSKQLVIKLLLNTVYGMCGYPRSQFYYAVLAGGVTLLGKKNIFKVNKYIEDRGGDVIYNDTDSSYFSPPSSWFKEINKQYYSGKISKLDYSTKLVELTQEYAADITPKINKYFRDTSASDRLQLNYEEVLWLVFWMAKKKYGGRKHENEVNHTSEELFIRGLEMIRRESSLFLKIIQKEIILKILDLDNTYPIIDLCKKVLLETYIRQWTKQDFLKSIVYRPNKQNIQAHTFYNRMKQRDDEYKANGIIRKSFCPIPNERFNYVMVKTHRWKYNYKGPKTEIGMGDKMEYLEYVIEHDLEIDMDYYVEHELLGVMARLITYHPQFYIKPIDNTIDAHKKSELSIFDGAKKYIRNMCVELRSKTHDHSGEIKIAFKEIQSQFKTNMSQRTGDHHVIFTIDHNNKKILRDKDLHNSKNKSIVRIGLIREITDRNRRVIIRQAVKNAQIYATNFIRYKRNGSYGTVQETIFNLKKQYGIMQKENDFHWNRKRNFVNDILHKLTEKTLDFHNKRDFYYKIYMENTTGLEYTFDGDDLNNYTGEDNIQSIIDNNIDDLNKMLEMNIQLVSVYEKLIRTDIILNKLQFAVNKQNGLMDQPTNLSLRDAINTYSRKYV